MDAAKQCNICKGVMRMSLFVKDARSKDGRGGRCKRCHADKSKEYRQENKDKIAAYLKKNRARFAVRLRLSSKRHYHKHGNGETARARSRAYSKKIVETLSDAYVSRLVSEGRHINPQDVPQWMIDLKRQEILLTRQIKDHEK